MKKSFKQAALSKFMAAVVGTGFLMSVSIAGANDADLLHMTPDQETSFFLEQFKKDPEKAMDLRLPKRDAQGKAIDHIETKFSQEDIKTGRFVDIRDEFRKNFCTMYNGSRICLKDYLPGKAPFGDEDKVEGLVEVPKIVRNLRDMEKQGLLKAEAPRKPWSDSYWPLAQGLVATRYAEAGFPHSPDWGANYSYVLSHPASAYFAAGSGSVVSPAEKYDYLVGDNSYSLTRASWARGKAAYDAYHMVESWDGICDGWSAAAISEDEPVKAINVTAANGGSVYFYPSDVKGLASILWANTTTPTRFIGHRCTIRNPERDSLGRTTREECWDSNPGTFHMAIVNQIGVAKRAFVMDATYDYEIWNYPTFSYHFSYFNPQTLQPANHWRDAMIPVDRFYVDRWKSHRSPNTKNVVGVSMFVTYMVELMPSTLEGPHAAPRTVHYIYDLELDADKNIIGGEWYSTLQHPDFMWAPPAGAKAMSVSDPHIADAPVWTGSNPIPADWVQPAQIASSNLQPMGVVIRKLVEQSSKK